MTIPTRQQLEKRIEELEASAPLSDDLEFPKGVTLPPEYMRVYARYENDGPDKETPSEELIEEIIRVSHSRLRST